MAGFGGANQTSRNAEAAVSGAGVRPCVSQAAASPPIPPPATDSRTLLHSALSPAQVQRPDPEPSPHDEHGNHEERVQHGEAADVGGRQHDRSAHHRRRRRLLHRGATVRAVPPCTLTFIDWFCAPSVHWPPTDHALASLACAVQKMSVALVCIIAMSVVEMVLFMSRDYFVNLKR
jgi:hypothetical protein